MKTSLFVTLLSAGVISSVTIGCQNEEGMGKGIMPDSDLAKVDLVETIDIEAHTELEKPVPSVNMSYMLVGKLNDPKFGTTETSFACKFSNTSYGKFAEGAVCDSVVLTLGVDTNSDYYYGDSLSNVTLEVYRLTDPFLNDDVAYTNDFEIEGKYDESSPLADTTFLPKDIDTCLKFYLDKAYGDTIIKHIQAVTFDDNVFGLYFRAKDTGSDGSIIKFYRSSSFTQYVVYYHVDGKDSTSSSVVFSIQSVDRTLNLSKHDYSGVDVLTDNKYVYLQAIVGTRVRIDITGLGKLNRGKYFSVRNARLVAPLADSAESQQSKYPAIDYYVCWGTKKADDTDLRTDTVPTFPEFHSNGSLLVFTRDVATNSYYLNLTGRINDLLDYYDRGEEVPYYIYLYPNGRTTDFKRSMICSPTHPETPMKLIVEYVNMDL